MENNILSEIFEVINIYFLQFLSKPNSQGVFTEIYTSPTHYHKLPLPRILHNLERNLTYRCLNYLCLVRRGESHQEGFAVVSIPPVFDVLIQDDVYATLFVGFETTPLPRINSYN